MNKIKLNNLEISLEDLIKEITGNKELMETLNAKFKKKDTGWFVPKEGEEYWYLYLGGIFCRYYNSFHDKDVIEIRIYQEINKYIN